MASLGSLAIDLSASTATLASDLSRAQGMVSKSVADINVTINSIGSGANFSAITSQVEGLKSSFSSLKGIVAGVFGVDIGARGVMELQHLADAYQGVTNRIITTTSSVQQLTAVQDALFQVAQQTGVALDETAKTYQRLEQVIQGSGRSQIEAQQEAIQLTKTLNQEIMLSGASQAEASRATQDLVHGLATGTLNMRQFRGVMMQMPDLTKRIADGLGVSQEKLFEMMHTGLSTQAVLDALAKEAGAIGQDFSKLPMTFGRAWTELNNAVEQYVGKASQAGTASNLIKDAIVGIADNIGAVANGVAAVGVGMAAWLGSKTLSAIGALVSTVKDAALAQGAYKTATMLSAEADIANATATEKAAAASADLALEKANAIALQQKELVVRAESELAAVNAAKAELSRASVLADTDLLFNNLTAAETRYNATAAESAALADKHAAALARLAAAQAAEAEAATANTAATQRLAESQAAATSATGLLSRAGSGLLAIIGGIPGLVVAAGAGLYYMAQQTTDLSDVTKQLNDEAQKQQANTISLTAAINALLGGYTAQKQSLDDLVASKRAEAQAELDQLESARKYNLILKAFPGFMAINIAQTERLNKALHDLDFADAGEKLSEFNAKLSTGVQFMQRLFGMSGQSASAAQPLIDALHGEQTAIDKETESMAKRNMEFGKSHLQIVQAVEEQKIAASGLKAGSDAYNEYAAAVHASYAEQEKQAKIEDDNAAKTKALAQANRDATSDQQILNKVLSEAGSAWDKANKLAGDLAANLGGPYAEAQKVYNAGLAILDNAFDGLNTQLNLGVINQAEYKSGVDSLIDSSEKLAEQFDVATGSIKSFDDILQHLQDTYQREEQLAGMTTQQRRIATEIERAENQALQDLQRTKKAGESVTQKELNDLHNSATAHVLNMEAIENATKAQEEYQRIAESGLGSIADSFGQFFTGQIKSWHDLGQSIIGSVKQMIAQVIAEYFKLRVLGPLIASLFGSGAAYGMSYGGGLASAGVSAAVGSFGGSGSIIGSIGQAFGFGGGDGPSTIFNPTSWVSAGQKLWNGFQTAGQTLGNWSASLFGTETYTPMGFVGPPSDLAPGFMGPSSSLAGPGALGYGGYGSAFGQGLGVAGGVIAGYNEYNAAGGGVAGLAGGAAYGVGTYTLGAGLAGLAAGGTAGMMAGLAALGPIGWIGLAAMAINMISGGKLFGTAAKPIGGDLTETIGATGATVTNVLHEKGQRALFGGAYYKDKNLAVDPAAQAAADAFFDALKKGTTDFAAQFGQTVGDIVGGSFVQSYDKNGKPTTTSSTVLGVTYTGETQAQFAERLQADNFLAVLDKMGIGASAFVQSVQGDADKLSQVVQDMASASQSAFHDIRTGLNLLGNGASIGDVMAEVMKLSGGPGTLAQTYADLSKATQALNTYLETASLNIGKTGAALVEFANDAAKAAGGADNLAKLMQTFTQDFYTPGQISAANISQLRGKVNAEGASIGQSANETDAQFLAAYNAVASSLTPDQLVAWQQFGVDLHELNAALDQAAQGYDQFIAQFTTSSLSPFEQAMVSLGDTLTANIKKANDLAIANGKSGASAEDIGKIISYSIEQGVQALQTLEAEAESLAQKLFQGDLQSQIDKLKAQADAGNQIASVQLLQLYKQQAQQQEQAAAQQQFLQAATLLGDLAQIGAINGKGLSDFAELLGIPLDKFASMLGTDQAGLDSQFKQQEDMAKAALDTAGNTKYTNEILADILAQSQGKALPYSLNDINDAATGQPISYGSAGGKGPGPIGATGPSAGAVADGTKPVVAATNDQTKPVVAATNDQTKQVVAATNDQTKQVVTALKDVAQLLRELKAGGFQFVPRNTRPMTPYTVMTP